MTASTVHNDLSQYEVREGSDGSMGIYLRQYNVRLARFSKNSDHLQRALEKLFNEARKV